MRQRLQRQRRHQQRDAAGVPRGAAGRMADGEGEADRKQGGGDHEGLGEHELGRPEVARDRVSASAAERRRRRCQGLAQVAGAEQHRLRMHLGERPEADEQQQDERPPLEPAQPQVGEPSAVDQTRRERGGEQSAGEGSETVGEAGRCWTARGSEGTSGRLRPSRTAGRSGDERQQRRDARTQSRMHRKDDQCTERHVAEHVHDARRTSSGAAAPGR